MDKYTALWISHSRIADFKKCPRAYFLKYVYKDPRNNHKIALIAPALALGQAVHEVLESLSVLPTADRFKVPLLERYKTAWAKISGKRGGFTDEATEHRYRERGENMLRRVEEHPGPLSRLAVKIKQDLPHYWLSESDNIILCGKIDWLEYIPDENAVNILDFKTGNTEESPDSLQLPIYYLLAHNCQVRDVKKASYWYVNRDDMPVDLKLPDLDHAHDAVLKHAKEIKLAHALDRFRCPAGEDGCKHCQPFEKVMKGEAEFVGIDEYNHDVYALLPETTSSGLPESEIL